MRAENKEQFSAATLACMSCRQHHLFSFLLSQIYLFCCLRTSHFVANQRQCDWCEKLQQTGLIRVQRLIRSGAVRVITCETCLSIHVYMVALPQQQSLKLITVYCKRDIVCSDQQLQNQCRKHTMQESSVPCHSGTSADRLCIYILLHCLQCTRVTQWTVCNVL
jgi:hypothetical protein